MVTIDNIRLKCDVIVGSVVNGSKQPNLFSFVLDKPPGYKTFHEPEKKSLKNFYKICSEYCDL